MIVRANWMRDNRNTSSICHFLLTLTYRADASYPAGGPTRRTASPSGTSIAVTNASVAVLYRRFRDAVVQGMDNHAVCAAERLSLAVRHDGHPIPEPEVQGRAAVEGELAFHGARKHVSSDAGGTGERINLDLLEWLDPGRGEKVGAY